LVSSLRFFPSICNDGTPLKNATITANGNIEAGFSSEKIYFFALKNISGLKSFLTRKYRDIESERSQT